MKTMSLNGKPVHELPLDEAPPAAPPREEKPTEAPPARRPRRLLLWLSIMVAAALGATYGWPRWQAAQSHETTDDAFIDAHVVAVAPRVAGHVLRLHVSDNQTVVKGQLLVEIDPADYQARVDQARAALDAAQRKLQTARLNVGVTHHASFGGYDQATAGVAQADATVQKADSAVSTSTASVSVAQSRLTQATDQVRAAQSGERQAQAEVARAAVEEDRTAKDERRHRELFRQGYVTAQQLDNVVAAHESARQSLAAARSQLDGSRSQLAAARSNEAALRNGLQQSRLQVAETRAAAEEARAQARAASGRLRQAAAAPEQVAVSQSDVLAANAMVAQALAALHQAELDLSHTRVYAPQEGRVTRRQVEEGGYFQVGQAMLSIVSPRVWVTANFKETQLARMKPGQPVTVRVDAYPHLALQGHVDSIQRGSGAAFSLLPPQNATGNYVKVVQRVPVKIVLDDPRAADYVLGPGMSVEPEVSLQ